MGSSSLFDRRGGDADVVSVLDQSILDGRAGYGGGGARCRGAETTRAGRSGTGRRRTAWEKEDRLDDPAGHVEHAILHEL